MITLSLANFLLLTGCSFLFGTLMHSASWGFLMFGLTSLFVNSQEKNN